jgi:hypothetical protein
VTRPTRLSEPLAFLLPYREELERAGVQNPGQFQSAGKALECYGRLARIAAQPEVA